MRVEIQLDYESMRGGDCADDWKRAMEKLVGGDERITIRQTYLD